MANDLSGAFKESVSQPNSVRPPVGEAPFSERELFFSRTDNRGVILSGNTVFQRVADYPWDKMIGAPHKIIRHPDMPRAVFWLLWRTIQAGKPIGAFVKNLAQDGLHYWVFATVSPVGEGYLSVRLKPTSPLLEVVEREYAALREREEEENLAPEDSAQLLLARLEELGFPDYHTFMATALLTELTCKQSGGGKRVRPAALNPLLAALTSLAALKTEIATLGRMLGDMTCTLVNMRLIASRIEGANGPISLMAQNYATVLSETRQWLHKFAETENGDLHKICAAIRVGAFDYGAATVQRQAIGQFRHETDLPPEVDRGTETALLEVEADRMMGVAAESLALIVACSRSLERAIQEVRRSCAGLNSTRLMCRAEAARLGNSGTFASIIDTLDQSQTQIEACADNVLNHCHDLRGQINRVADCMPTHRVMRTEAASADPNESTK